MDKPKLRFAAGVGAAVFGVVGVAIFAMGFACWVEPHLGWAGALFVTGAGLFSVAALMLFVFTRPNTSTQEEFAKIEALTAETLAELPFSTLSSIVEKRPNASLAVAAAVGYLFAKDPKSASKNIGRVISGLL